MGDKQAPVILLVDDEADIREMIRRFLEDKGFQIYEAEDGLRAVELAEQIHPDLVLMDLSMPHLDGESAAKQIRYLPQLRSVPIVFMTAFGTRGMDLYSHIDKLASGPVEYVPKPIYDLNHLLELIRSLVRSEGVADLNNFD